MKSPQLKINVRFIRTILFVVLVLINITSIASNSNKTYFIDESSSYFVKSDTWSVAPGAGDTIFVSSTRTEPLRFQQLSGSATQPLVVINTGGQVRIDSPTAWGAITFENCRYIKISGAGHPDYKYGFHLAAATCGLAFSELSSDCEAEFVKISHEGFFGIFAKKDYGGNPPSPAPVFENLIIHDCFIENVTEGMYLGETKSPGMEFKHVRIYNNIVRNTGREAMQIANMVEDVEIYNNTLLNAGRDNEKYQNNILQIGDNSVANVYNNILIGAPNYGIISLGKGNNIYSNNYIASCNGMFIDTRLFTSENLPVVVSGNYFTSISDPEIIRNMNDKNHLVLNNNKYDGSLTFFNNVSGNDNNFTLANNLKVAVDTISFENAAENNYALSQTTSTVYKNMGAPGGAFIDYEPGPVSQSNVSKQIILNSSMIVDEVSGGSLSSANFLVDEQNMTPENGLHPTSQSWKPYWNMNKAPYHVYFDLGESYNITNIALHDMNDTRNIVVEYGEPGNWQNLFTDPLDKYKTWKEHSVDIKTRYIRLSMYESVFAAVNEIVVFGYKDSTAMQQKSANINQATVTPAITTNAAAAQTVTLIQNPVKNKLRLNLSNDLKSNFKIEVFDFNGSRFLEKSFATLYSSSELDIDITDYNLKKGCYLVRYSNLYGVNKTLKFVKAD